MYQYMYYRTLFPPKHWTVHAVCICFCYPERKNSIGYGQVPWDSCKYNHLHLVLATTVWEYLPHLDFTKMCSCHWNEVAEMGFLVSILISFFPMTRYRVTGGMQGFARASRPKPSVVCRLLLSLLFSVLQHVSCIFLHCMLFSCPCIPCCSCGGWVQTICPSPLMNYSDWLAFRAATQIRATMIFLL